MNTKQIAMIAMLALSATMSFAAFAGENSTATDSEVTQVGMRVLEVWRDGNGNATEAVVAIDWSDGSTTYEIRPVERG